MGIICGFYKAPRDPSIQIIPIMKNQMEKKMENQVIQGGLYSDPSIQMIPTLGPNVYKSYLHEHEEFYQISNPEVFE